MDVRIFAISGIADRFGQAQIDLARTLIIGELSLDGVVRHTNGVLPMAAMAREKGFRTLFVPASDASEAALIPDLEIYPIESLFALSAHLQGLQLYHLAL